MKKFLLFFSIFLSLFLLRQIKTVSAQENCNCVSQYVCINTPCTAPGNSYYECKPESLLCPNGGPCKCDPQRSDQPIQNCNPGTCQEPIFQCEDRPNHRCTINCGLGNRWLAADPSCQPGYVCCRIDPSTTGRINDCCSLSSDPNRQTCNTECLWGINVPGFTCQEKTFSSGQQMTNNCRCTCTSPTIPGEEESLIGLDIHGQCGEGAIDTAIGCIPTDPSSLVQTVISFIIGLAGVIAFLLMVFAAIKIILAGGNPEKLQAGKEMFTSAIIGLILIIFSTVILELIGVHILQIPGFFE